MRIVHAEPELEEEYLRAVQRRAELERLDSQARQRKCMLVFGPEGVGKTRLLQEFFAAEPLALYVPQARSPRELLETILSELGRTHGTRSFPSGASRKSACSLKGLVDRALDAQPFLMILDHLEGPSRVVSKVVKELHYYGRTPVILGARSAHMEDVGALEPLCAGKAERMELMNWRAPVALEFARREAERTGLRASNLDAALHSIVHSSKGNPGSIVHMLEMAHQPRYRIDDQIKFHVLYLDHRMGRRPARDR